VRIRTGLPFPASRFFASVLSATLVWGCLAPVVAFGAESGGCCGCCAAMRPAPAPARNDRPDPSCGFGLSRDCCGNEPAAPAESSPAARWALIPRAVTPDEVLDSSPLDSVPSRDLASRAVAPPEQPPRAS
jgi:hypothetical protein